MWGRHRISRGSNRTKVVKKTQLQHRQASLMRGVVVKGTGVCIPTLSPAELAADTQLLACDPATRCWSCNLLQEWCQLLGMIPNPLLVCPHLPAPAAMYPCSHPAQPALCSTMPPLLCSPLPPLPLPLTFMLASMSTVPTSRSSVTPSGICTKGAERIFTGTSPAPSFSARPSCEGWRGGEKGAGKKPLRTGVQEGQGVTHRVTHRVAQEAAVQRCSVPAVACMLLMLTAVQVCLNIQRMSLTQP